MVKEFKKISVDEEVHEELKADRKKFNLKNISDTIRYYKNGKKEV